MLVRDCFASIVFAAVLMSLPAPAKAQRTCEELADLVLPQTIVISAREMPAGPMKIPQVVAAKGCESTAWSEVGAPCADVSDRLPAFCRVALKVEPQIYIEVWLPKQREWNGRFLGVGSGGYAGWINYAELAASLRAGYASASTDTGHPFYMDRAFAIRADGSLDQQLIEDFSWRSLRQLVLKAKSLMTAFYGVPAKYSYWSGCSTGGRQGLVAVQRFPEEYDGVLAGSPAINWDRYAPSLLWPLLASQQEVGGMIASAKLEYVTRNAIAACDKDDGVIDGLIADPRACKYDPSGSVCRDKTQSDGCLTVGEANAVRKIWDGPRSERTGERLWFGLERGANITLFASVQPNRSLFPIDYFKDMITQDRAFDWRTLGMQDYERDIRKSYTKFNEVFGNDKTNLQGWAKRQGKLIIWHDEADGIIAPRGTLNYLDRILAANGGAEEVRKFARVYMVPGSSHCGVAEVPWMDSMHYRHKLFDALVNWVERGNYPNSIVVSRKLREGVSTRPLCPYPTIAAWTGKGSSRLAQNFECVSVIQNADDIKVANFEIDSE